MLGFTVIIDIVWIVVYSQAADAFLDSDDLVELSTIERISWSSYLLGFLLKVSIVHFGLLTC